MIDDLYGLYSAFFDFNPRKDLCLDNEVYGKAEIVAPDDEEIMILEQVFGNVQGKTLEVELSRLLEILPRKRRRIDAFSALVKNLKTEKDCDLIIKSRKSK